MYFISGGAFQGKRKWVKQQIKDFTDVVWINGYVSNGNKPDQYEEDGEILVIEGLEALIKQSIGGHAADARSHWNKIIYAWETWEKQKSGRSVYIIGCDIGSGIVPLNTHDRIWRDVVGWVYQDLSAKADQVVRIWCGIEEVLK